MRWGRRREIISEGRAGHECEDTKQPHACSLFQKILQTTLLLFSQATTQAPRFTLQIHNRLVKVISFLSTAIGLKSAFSYFTPDGGKNKASVLDLPPFPT